MHVYNKHSNVIIIFETNLLTSYWSKCIKNNQNKKDKMLLRKMLINKTICHKKEIITQVVS